MRELVRLFTDITLLRRGPQDLPASPLLLVLTIGAYLVLFLLASAIAPRQQLPAQGVLYAAFTVAWYAVLLRLVGRPERTLQTLTGLFAVQLVLSPLQLGADVLLLRFPQDSPTALPIVTAAFVIVIWLIIASSRIVKAALEWTTGASVGITLLQLLIGGLLVLAVLNPERP
ncbi:MAG TPA: hypothetical protein VH109_06195 [Steroidobacteraceae bacterium]|nr:hypothetical protein [Steroidobacteraceae bacterium]